MRSSTLSKQIRCKKAVALCSDDTGIRLHSPSLRADYPHCVGTMCNWGVSVLASIAPKGNSVSWLIMFVVRLSYWLIASLAWSAPAPASVRRHSACPTIRTFHYVPPCS